MSVLRWVRLLAAVWAAAQCGASESANISLETVINRTGQFFVENFTTELNGRLASVQTQLATQTADLASRLDSIEARLTAAQTSHSSAMTEQQTQTARLVSRLDSIEARLTAAQTSQSSARTEVQTQTTNMASRLIGVQTAVDNIQSELGSVNSDMISRLDSVHDLLTAIVPRRDCTDLPAVSTSGIHLLSRA